MAPTRVSPRNPEAFSVMDEILRRNLELGGSRYSIHPGDLAWWVYHADPRAEHEESYWLDGDSRFAVLGGHEQEVVAFALPDQSPLDLIRWGMESMRSSAFVGMISTLDDDLEAELTDSGMVPVFDRGPLFIRDLSTPIPEPEIAAGWSLRPVLDESEADNRRAASHAAFESTMAPDDHLERYLRFMRSPVYDPSRDLVAVAPDGRIAAFVVWWPDPSGTAEIEPMGTDPAFHRQGIGRALMSFAFSRMKEAGMSQVRVITDANREAAIGFYRAMGFEELARLRNWRRP